MGIDPDSEISILTIKQQTLRYYDFHPIVESNNIGDLEDDKVIRSGKINIYCLPHHSFDSILFPSEHSLGSSST